MTNDRLHLKPWPSLTALEQQAVLGLSVSAEQVEYAGTVERAVRNAEAAEDSSGNLVGLAILTGMEVVGFLVLKRQGDAPEWALAGDAVISAMRIDLSRQGQGLGARALREVIGWVASHWPGSRRVVLSVDEDNLAGRRAYEKAGFLDEGRRERGRIGWVRFMAVGLA